MDATYFEEKMKMKLNNVNMTQSRTHTKGSERRGIEAKRITYGRDTEF